MLPEAWLDRLIEAGLADRQVRSLRYQLKAARFPVHRDLTGIDWAETPLPRAQIEQLASAAFMETAHNLILVGGIGTGKTHRATALGVAAIHRACPSSSTVQHPHTPSPQPNRLPFRFRSLRRT